jgi:hypothetical protein
MAIVPSDCLTGCLGVDTVTGLPGNIIDPNGGLECGPNGERLKCPPRDLGLVASGGDTTARAALGCTTTGDRTFWSTPAVNTQAVGADPVDHHGTQGRKPHTRATHFVVAGRCDCHRLSGRPQRRRVSGNGRDTANHTPCHGSKCRRHVNGWHRSMLSGPSGPWLQTNTAPLV